MAAEFKDEVAVNCMWPRTTIWTAAVEMLGGEEMSKTSRTPQIMADTAYSILCQDTSFTGNFLIDEHYLRDNNGITDFRPYQVDPSIDPSELSLDLYLEELNTYDDSLEAIKVEANPHLKK